MAIVTLINGEEVRAQGLTYSSVDPGGFDQCSFKLDHRRHPDPGAQVLVLDGLEVCWMGVVEEPGQHHEYGRESSSVVAIGHGDELARDPYSMVYIDRDLGRWREPSRARTVALITAGYGPQGFTVRPDVSSGAPSLTTEVSGDWSAKPIGEAGYDAGPGNLIGRLRATWTRGSTVSDVDANWTWLAALMNVDDDVSSVNYTGNLRAAGPGTIDLIANAARRYAFFQILYGTGSTGHVSAVFDIDWTDVRVIGDHGLPIASVASTTYLGPDGLPVTAVGTDALRAEDIARHALAVSGSRLRPLIEQSGPAGLVQHLAFYDRVQPRTVVDQMATWLAWHWGAWEPESALGTEPTLRLTSRPSRATVTVRYEDCADVEVIEKFTGMHDRAQVKYSTPVEGTGGYVDIVIEHPRGGFTRRPLELDAGVVGNAGVAATIGQDLLLLDQANGRASGSVTLPARTLEGRLSHLLRPGRDRLGLAGLPLTGSDRMLAESQRVDTVRVQRLEVAVEGGVPRAVVQFDPGADLVESLNARLGVASVLAGAG